MNLLYNLFFLAAAISLGCHFVTGSESLFEGPLTPAKQLAFFLVLGYVVSIYCNYKVRSQIGLKKHKEVFGSFTLFVASAISLYTYIETIYYFIVHRLDGIEGYLILPFLFFCVSSVWYIRGFVKSLSSIFIRKTLPFSEDDILQINEEKRKEQYALVSRFGIKPEEECLMCIKFDKVNCNRILGEMVVSRETGYENWKKQKKFVLEGVFPDFAVLSRDDSLAAEQVSLMTLLMIFRTSEKEISELSRNFYYKALFMLIASYCRNEDGAILSSFITDDTVVLPVDKFTFDLAMYKKQLEAMRSGIIMTRDNYGIDTKFINQEVLFIQNFLGLDEERQKDIIKHCLSKILMNEYNQQVAIPQV